MNWILVILLAVLLVNIWLAFRITNKKEEGSGEGLKLLLQQFNELARTMDSKLGEGNKTMHEFMSSQSSQAQKLMSTITKQVSDQLLEVVKGVSETKESTKQVFTIAEQLRNLEKVLKNQKLRGNLGEASLELILSNVLPGQYETQYMFKDGEKVDFIIKTRDGLLPVDAKFPLENYMRLVDELDDERREMHRREFKNDVKKRIDETAKYIRPEEGTMPFAFMFIPAEGIYYDLLNNDVGMGVNSRDLIEYAYQQKNVIIASPTTFLAYLQTILFGNKRAKIQEAANDIIKNVSELAKHLDAYQDSHNSLGKSLAAAVNHYDKAGKSFKQIDKDVLKITGDKIGVETLTLERPTVE
ncbi:DNA recombination protein RmuC [Candidatus Parcubacteria bacterium]|nr:DNA recombination protein RmuC [Candidatus Parcubacteria bacterium]